MTWLWVIIGVAVVGGIIGLLTTNSDKDKGEGFFTGFFGAGTGCALIIFQIFIALLSIYLLFKLGSWLFS